MAYLRFALYALLAIIVLTPLAVIAAGLCIGAWLALRSFWKAWSEAWASYRAGKQP